jgi:hypothetical protein
VGAIEPWGIGVGVKAGAGLPGFWINRNNGPFANAELATNKVASATDVAINFLMSFSFLVVVNNRCRQRRGVAYPAPKCTSNPDQSAAVSTGLTRILTKLE